MEHSRLNAPSIRSGFQLMRVALYVVGWRDKSEKLSQGMWIMRAATEFGSFTYHSPDSAGKPHAPIPLVRDDVWIDYCLPLTSVNQGFGSRAEMLPKAEDYKPPKEFREELLESLKEKFPETYEDIIHKYFKRLSE